MPDLAQLGNELRADPPVPVTPVEVLRRRIARRRRRRLVLVSVAAVALAGTTVGLIARGAHSPLRVSTDTGQPRRGSTGPTGPSRPGGPLPAVGTVSVLAHGVAGRTRWWYVTYDTVQGSSPKPAQCVLLVGDDGQPFPGGGGCSTPTGGQATGSTLGFAHIGGHDFAAAETFEPIDSVEVRTRSGAVLTAPALPLPGRRATAWVVELPTTGELNGYSERAQSAIEQISTVSNGVRATVFRPAPPQPVGGVDVIAGIARAAAVANAGRTSPTEAQIVHTTRSQYYKAIHEAWGNSERDTAIILIQMKGQFVARNATPPQGLSSPTGTILDLAIDAKTGTPTDFNLGNRAIDLAALGRVTTVPLMP